MILASFIWCINIDVVSNNYTVNAWKFLTTHAVESGVTTFCKQTYSQVQLALQDDINLGTVGVIH